MTIKEFVESKTIGTALWSRTEVENMIYDYIKHGVEISVVGNKEASMPISVTKAPDPEPRYQLSLEAIQWLNGLPINLQHKFIQQGYDPSKPTIEESYRANQGSINSVYATNQNSPTSILLSNVEALMKRLETVEVAVGIGKKGTEMLKLQESNKILLKDNEFLANKVAKLEHAALEHAVQKSIKP